MLTIAVLCGGLLAALPDVDVNATAPDPAAYEAAYREARTKVGRDPDAHVRLALWCEARGLDAERLKHLAIAALIDPGHASARGLMGLVSHAGRWTRPDAVAERAKDDPARAALREEYKARRDKTVIRADPQWKLALWCEENGLEAEAKAHLMILLRLDPDHAGARKRLGYKKHNGAWATPAQIAGARADAELQKKADRAWKPRLEKLREQLGGKDEAKRLEAERALAAVTDPRAVPSVWAVFANGAAARQGVAVQLLGQIDGPAASRALALMAVESPHAGVRQAATQTLARRDGRDFVGLLIAQLVDPIKYEVRPVAGPGSKGVLFVEGKEFNVRRTYGTPDVHPQAGLPRIYAPNIPYHTLAAQNELLVSQGLWGLNLGGLSAQDIKGLAANPKGAVGQLQSLARNEEEERERMAIARDAAALREKMRYVHAPGFADWGEVYRRHVLVYPEQVRQYQREKKLYDKDLAKFKNDYLNDTLSYLTAAAIRRDLELGLIEADVQRATLEAGRQLELDVQALKEMNAEVHRANERVLPVLEAVTGQDLGEDHGAWQAWWADQQGLALRQPGEVYKPTREEVVEVPFSPVPIAVGTPPERQAPEAPWQPKPPSLTHNCFGAGTPVRTESGLRPIETIRAGDRILTQDVRTGGLSFQPVLVAYHNPPNETLRVSLGRESIVATGIHRFWKAGHGWTMARELKVGDPIRLLGGVAKVTAVEDAGTQPVFNVEVAEGGSFFVGEVGALVHDNSLVEATPEPFDAVSDAPAVARAQAATAR